MANSDVIIYSLPGGRGRLVPISGGTFEGTYLMPDGKYDRRRFKQPNNAKAVSAYKRWVVEMDGEVARMMEERENPQKAKAKASSTNRAAGKRKEPTMAQTSTGADRNAEVAYIVMVVGGPAVTWCETFDKAASVCDALSMTAKASGFSARYDVVEVRKWTA